MKKKIDLSEYKDINGKFVALVVPNDPYWQTVEGQDHLCGFYYFEELCKAGQITEDQKQFQCDQIIHPNEPCKFSAKFHDKFSKKQISALSSSL